MDSTNRRILDLEARIAKYEIELDAATAVEEKQRLSDLIKSRTEMATALIMERNTALQGNIVGSSYSKYRHSLGLGANVSVHMSVAKINLI